MPYGQPSNHVDMFCQSIIVKDPSIRFAGIANQMGKLIATAYRAGLQPLMSMQETEHYTVQTVLRASTRETFENKIGKQKYAIAVYEKLIRATIPITNIVKDANEQKEKKEQHQEEQDLKRLYLLISFNVNSDVISILEDKILPDIKQFEKDLSAD
ncbi:MAG: hypothetical protein M3270_07045 [Thermoproteota archaeon]|nr:hypothetical protein [Thermoproteota archaeon]